MTLEERIAEFEATIAAILAGRSGWPQGSGRSPIRDDEEFRTDAD
jgi:hypothetical protein